MPTMIEKPGGVCPKIQKLGKQKGGESEKWDIERIGSRIMNQIMVGTLARSAEKKLEKQMPTLTTSFLKNMAGVTNCLICNVCVSIAIVQSRQA